MLRDLKLLLLGMLENAFSANDITATQQMGVQLSNAVKRDGVVIIQNQNVEVYARIMPSLVRALKMCDELEGPPPITVTHSQAVPLRDVKLPRELPHADPIQSFCEYMYDQNVGWVAIQKIVRRRYLELALEREGTMLAAARKLGVGATYLCKIKKDLKDVPTLPSSE